MTDIDLARLLDGAEKLADDNPEAAAALREQVRSQLAASKPDPAPEVEVKPELSAAEREAHAVAAALRPYCKSLDGESKAA
jgi:hypothetical protein